MSVEHSTCTDALFPPVDVAIWRSPPFVPYVRPPVPYVCLLVPYVSPLQTGASRLSVLADGLTNACQPYQPPDKQQKPASIRPHQPDH